MAKIYTKSTWVDEILAGDARYDIKEDDGTPITNDAQIDLATVVTVAGTTVDATKMNNLETGVDALDTLVAAMSTPTTDAENDFQVGGTGGTAGIWIKKTLAQVKTILAIAVKATGAEINTGTDDAKFATPKALRDGGVSKVNAQFQLLCGGIIPATTNGCTAPAAIEMTTNKNMIKPPAFNKDTEQYGSFRHELPSDYNGGTITFHVNWCHPATTTNFKVAWALKAVAVTDDGTLDVAFGTAVQVNDTGGTTYDLYQSPESAALTIAGTPLAGKEVCWCLYRVAADDTNDTLAVDAYPLEVVITYTRTA
jgi:hypothetical protein